MAKYRDIYNELYKRIEEGKYTIDMRLPDEISFCEEFSCSRMTMKKALDMLVSEGIIYRKQGQGTFVRTKIATVNRLNLMDRDLAGLTRSTDGQAKSKILEFKLIFSDEKVSEKLRVKENSPIYEIVRVRYLNNMPFVIEKTYMPANLIKDLTKNVLISSIYNYIECELGLTISSAQKVIRADRSNAIDIKFLEIDEKDPILEIEQIAFLDNGVPFEYSFSRHRYDKFEFTSFSVRR